jgi:hypothetical protein
MSWFGGITGKLASLIETGLKAVVGERAVNAVKSVVKQAVKKVIGESLRLNRLFRERVADADDRHVDRVHMAAEMLNADDIRTRRAARRHVDRAHMPAEMFNADDIRTRRAARRHVDRVDMAAEMLNALIEDAPEANYIVHDVVPPVYQEWVNNKVNEARGDWEDIVDPAPNRANKRVKERYYNNLTSMNQIFEIINRYHYDGRYTFTIQISFGYVVGRETIGENEGETLLDAWVYKPIENEGMFRLNDRVHPLNIASPQEFDDMLELLTMPNIVARAPSPQSQTTVYGVYAMRVQTILTNFRMGDGAIPLPAWITNHPGHFFHLKDNSNMCLFYCLALAHGNRHDRYATYMKKKYKEYYGMDYNKNYYYGGFDVTQISRFEEQFEVCITFLEVAEPEKYVDVPLHMQTELPDIAVRQRSIHYKKTNFTKMHVLLYGNHLIFIKKYQNILKSFKCCECTQQFHNSKGLNKHMNTCSLIVKESFPKKSQQFEPGRNVILELCDLFDVQLNCDHYYDYVAAFDHECMFRKFSGAAPQFGTQIKAQHIGASVSACSNVDDYKSAKFLCIDNYANDTSKMNWALIEYLGEIQMRAENYMRKKFSKLEDVIVRRVQSAQHQGKNTKWLMEQLEKYTDYVAQLPIVGFNSGKYDLNLNMRHGLLQALVEDGIKFTAKKGNKYMCIATRRFRFLDILNFESGGCNLEKFLKAYTPDMDIKGKFPYEWFDDIKKLEQTYLPAREDFTSQLKGEHMSEKDYAVLQKVWVDKHMKTMRDFLEWYNNLDVVPLVTAVMRKAEFYKRYGLDMLKDAISGPGLAEKIMFTTAKDGLEEFEKKGPEPVKEIPEFYWDESYFVYKRGAYAEQDMKKNRDPYGKEYTGLGHMRQLLQQSNFCCHYCHEAVTRETFTLDRINCYQAHTVTNCVVACVKCNKARSDQPYKRFKRMSVLERFHKVKKQVYLVDSDNQEIFHLLMKNVVGGPSIVFHRYHEASKTQIKRAKLNGNTWQLGEGGNVVRQIVGYDANALYLWCMAQDMPCGKLQMFAVGEEKEKQENILMGVRSDQAFGFVEVDINVPPHLYQHFSEMTPLFKNTEIGFEHLSPLMQNNWTKLHTKTWTDQNGKVQTKTDNHVPQRKLIGSYHAEKILLYTPLLKWYLEHGLVVTKSYRFIQAERARPFEKFAEDVSNARRAGDVNDDLKMIGEGMKQTGNDGFGRTVMNRKRHTQTIYTNDENKLLSLVNNKLFNGVVEIETEKGPVWEVSMNKGTIKQNMPAQIGCAIFNMAKLRILQFYYDCLDKFIARENFQMIQMDTDSCYLAIAGESDEELAKELGVEAKELTAEMRMMSLVKPEMRAQFEKEQYQWFPDERTKESKALNKRTPGLFKVEFVGHAMVALAAKSYYGLNKANPDKSKMSAKGVQKNTFANRELLIFDRYKQCLDNQEYLYALNIGFKMEKGVMSTYEQVKVGMTPLYDKRAVMYDAVSTVPLNI